MRALNVVGCLDGKVSTFFCFYFFCWRIFAEVDFRLCFLLRHAARAVGDLCVLEGVSMSCQFTRITLTLKSQSVEMV